MHSPTYTHIHEYRLEHVEAQGWCPESIFRIHLLSCSFEAKSPNQVLHLHQDLFSYQACFGDNREWRTPWVMKSWVQVYYCHRCSQANHLSLRPMGERQGLSQEVKLIRMSMPSQGPKCTCWLCMQRCMRVTMMYVHYSSIPLLFWTGRLFLLRLWNPNFLLELYIISPDFLFICL